MVIELSIAAPRTVSVPSSDLPSNFQAGAAPALAANTALRIASAASAAPKEVLIALRFIVSSSPLRSTGLWVRFIVSQHGGRRSDEDRVVEDCRVVAFGGRAELGVDDRIDQE